MLSWLQARHRNRNEEKFKQKHYNPLPDEEIRTHSDGSFFICVKDCEIDVIVESCQDDGKHLQNVGKQVE